MYSATVCIFLLCSCKSWPLLVVNLWFFCVIDRRCLRSIVGVLWEHWASNDEMRGRKPHAGSRPLYEIIALLHLQWVGRVFRMPVHRLTFRAGLARDREGWKMRRGCQAIYWRRSMRVIASVLA